MKFTKATVLSGLLATAVAVPTSNSARREAELARNVARGQKHNLGPQGLDKQSGSWGMGSAIASGTAAAAPSDFGGFGGFGVPTGAVPSGSAPAASGFGGAAAPTGTGSGPVASDVASSVQPEFTSAVEAATSEVAPVATSSAVVAPVSSTSSASSVEATSSAVVLVASTSSKVASTSTQVASSSSAVHSTEASSTASATTAVSTSSAATTEEKENDEYNVSWSGALLNDGETVYTGVSATFTIPTPKVPTVGETSADVWTVSSWIGIDGVESSDDCTGLWQAGVDASIDSSGTLSYDAWYEWYPASTLDMELEVTAGDIISVNLTYSSFTEGTVTMDNLTTGKSSTKSATSTSKICGLAAEWIMEDLSIDGDTIGLANYGAVTFSDAVATTSSGASVGPVGSQFMDIETSASEKLTSTDITETSVTVTYV